MLVHLAASPTTGSSWRFRVLRLLLLLAVLAVVEVAPALASSRLPETIQAVKRSVVAVGTFQATRRPPALFKGTGFAVGNGRRVVTNAHVVDGALDIENKERLAIFVPRGDKVEQRTARIVGRDPVHDVAVLEISGSPLPSLALDSGPVAVEGTSVVFTGFPIGTVLGLYHVTHRGMISAVTPIAIPQLSMRQLDVKMIRQLQKGFQVYQLDATAYPGNSGSPVYGPDSGEVIGIVSSVFVKDTKERVLQDPSGITYAIPIRHAIELIKGKGVN